MREDTTRRSFDVDDEYIDLAAEVFSLLCDPTRIRIILSLRTEELMVGELAERVGKSPTAVSQHLAKLRWAKVVQSRHDGNRVYYSLIDHHARELVDQAVFQAEHVVDIVPRHHVDSAPAPSQRVDQAGAVT
jgi:DNA-binding transcriptional ArsR family regulator